LRKNISAIYGQMQVQNEFGLQFDIIVHSYNLIFKSR
jgi:hypothetical protein